MNFFGVDLETKYRHLCETPSDINDALPVLRQFASKVKHVTEFGIRTAVSTTALLAAQPDRLISYDVETKTPGVHLITKGYPEEKLERWRYDDESRSL